jgi:hypothetical protein
MIEYPPWDIMNPIWISLFNLVFYYAPLIALLGLVIQDNIFVSKREKLEEVFDEIDERKKKTKEQAIVYMQK